MNVHRLARALGWFSIGLGVLEVVAPGALARALGARPRRGLVRAYGAREIATGLGILTRRRRAPWLWARVVGDLLDLGTLLVAARRGGARLPIAGAAASVAGVMALDVLGGARLSRAEPAAR